MRPAGTGRRGELRRDAKGFGARQRPSEGGSRLSPRFLLPRFGRRRRYLWCENNKAPRPCGPGAKFGGGRSPRALSQRHTVRRLAFAGRVLPDATLRGMRMFRSHGGTVPTVSGWNLSSEVSSPSSVTSCRKRLAGRGADTPAIPNLSRRHRGHGDGSSFWPDVGPALRV